MQGQLQATAPAAIGIQQGNPAHTSKPVRRRRHHRHRRGQRMATGNLKGSRSSARGQIATTADNFTHRPRRDQRIKLATQGASATRFGHHLDAIAGHQSRGPQSVVAIMSRTNQRRKVGAPRQHAIAGRAPSGDKAKLVAGSGLGRQYPSRTSASRRRHYINVKSNHRRASRVGRRHRHRHRSSRRRHRRTTNSARIPIRRTHNHQSSRQASSLATRRRRGIISQQSATTTIGDNHSTNSLPLRKDRGSGHSPQNRRSSNRSRLSRTTTATTSHQQNRQQNNHRRQQTSAQRAHHKRKGTKATSQSHQESNPKVSSQPQRRWGGARGGERCGR